MGRYSQGTVECKGARLNPMIGDDEPQTNGTPASPSTRIRGNAWERLLLVTMNGEAGREYSE